MLKAKQQGVLLLTALSHLAGRGPAAPKTTPENNSPGDGETRCSSLAQLAGSGPPPGRGAAGLAGENKGISGVKRLRLKSLRVAAEEPAPAVCTRRAWPGGEGCWLLPGGIGSLPSPRRGSGTVQPKAWRESQHLHPFLVFDQREPSLRHTATA